MPAGDKCISHPFIRRGDCNDSSDVTVNELLIMVNIALGSADISTCRAGDADQNGEIAINEIIAAVNNALNGVQ